MWPTDRARCTLHVRRDPKTLPHELISKYNIFLYRVGTARGQPDLGPGQGRAGEGAGAQVSDVPLNDTPVTHSARVRERARVVQEVGHFAPSAVEVDVVRVGLGHMRQPSE